MNSRMLVATSTSMLAVAVVNVAVSAAADARTVISRPPTPTTIVNDTGNHRIYHPPRGY